jgi:thymidine kinase
MNENVYNENIHNHYSYLELILGPMYSGKTSALVNIYKQCILCNIPVVVINHNIDKRYHNIHLSTHDQITIPCIKTEKLMELLNNDIHNDIHNDIMKSNIILINEGQFFDDLVVFVQKMLSYKKKIYICGLDGDFERKKFGQILNLIPLCDKVCKLNSLCSICKNGKKGIFSMRLTNETEQTVVGSDNYIPVCRECYDNKKNNI